MSEADGRKSSAKPWLLLFLVIAAAVGLGYLGWGQLEGEKAASESARRAADELSNKLSAAETARKATEAKLDGLTESNAQLQSDRDALAEQVKEKDSELAKLKATYDKLEDKLAAEIKKGDIRLTQHGGRLQVDLVDKILFDSGSAALSPRGEEVLAKVGGVLATVEDKQIQVSGHTDDAPILDKLKDTYPTNWELSTARAVNVVRFLSEKAAVPPRRLLAAGFGPYHPIANNGTPQGRARNRRIEILLIPSLDPKAVALAKTVKPAPAHPAAAPHASVPPKRQAKR